VDESALRRGKVFRQPDVGQQAFVLVAISCSPARFNLVRDDNLAVLDILAGASAIIAEGK